MISLKNQGYGEELARSVIGYSPKDVPYVYSTDPSYPNNGTLKSELWMGSVVSKEELVGVWSDQIPEVIVQWRGHTPIKGSVCGKREVNRLEVHHLGDGSFVQLEFRNVSDTGAFDGKLKYLDLYKLKEETNYSGKLCKEYSIHKIHRVGVRWVVDLGFSSFSGTTMLNAWQEILQFRVNTYMIKPDIK